MEKFECHQVAKSGIDTKKVGPFGTLNIVTVKPLFSNL